MKETTSQSLPLISVALCTYNGSKYLEHQLQSILNQTYKNIEIVIGDDRSTDNTIEIIEKFARKHPNIRYYTNSENLGFNKNFEKAIRLTKGEYISISDQDDIWNPLKLAKLIDKIGENWLIFSNSSFINDYDQISSGKLLYSFSLKGRSYRSFLLTNYVTGHTVLFKRTFLTYCLPFPSVKFYDWWMGFIAMYHHKLTYLDETLTYYRIHPLSVIQKQLIESTHNESQNTLEFKTVRNQLRYFQNYPHLKEGDRNFIKNLRHAYIQRRNKYSLSLFKIILCRGNHLLPPSQYKKNNLISAIHFSKKVT